MNTLRGGATARGGSPVKRAASPAKPAVYVLDDELANSLLGAPPPPTAPRPAAEPAALGDTLGSSLSDTLRSERSGRGASPSRPHGAPAPELPHLARWRSLEETDAERKRRDDAARRAQLMRPADEDFGPPHDDPDSEAPGRRAARLAANAEARAAAAAAHAAEEAAAARERHCRFAAAAAKRDARFESNLEAVSHGMEGLGGVNARIDRLLAAEAAALDARKARSYQEWRAGVFEAIQSQVDARMAACDAAALEARLHARYEAFLAADAKPRGVFRDGPLADDVAAAASRPAPVNYAAAVDPLKADLRRREAERAAMAATAAVLRGGPARPSEFEFGGEWGAGATRGILPPDVYGDVKTTTRHGRWTDSDGGAAELPARGAAAAAGGAADVFDSRVTIRHDGSLQPRAVLDAELPPRTRAPVTGVLAAAAASGGASGDAWQEARGRRQPPREARPAAGESPAGAMLAHAYLGPGPPPDRPVRPKGPGRPEEPARAPPAGAFKGPSEHARRPIPGPPMAATVPPPPEGRKHTQGPRSAAARTGAARGMFDVLADPAGSELDRPTVAPPPPPPIRHSLPAAGEDVRRKYG